ncbi:lipase family protein [Nocardia callitridis]|uniref:Prolyl oligopeptidase family serine peptidase n=1 Tax=Nocardia callitridis TaxID=648753 RepID=A0ABP9K424_9NOCA
MMCARIVAGLLVVVSASLLPTTAAAHAQQPGVVTDSSAIEGRLHVAGAASATRLTYWSRGPRGPMRSTGVVYVPEGDAPAGGWPIVAYAHGTVGLADQCVFTMQARDYYLDSVYPDLLRAGYAVVVSDYVGLGTEGTHPYLDGPAQARSVVDGVRAARALTPTLGVDWAVVGQSQGGQSALFTGNLGPGDAKELRLRGVAATGPASNLELLVPLAGPWIPRLPLRNTTTYFAMLLAGLRDNAPELNIDGYLTPLGRRSVELAATTCMTEADEQLGEVSIGSMLSRPLNDPALLAETHRMLHVPTDGYSVPVLIGQGATDQDVPAPLTAALAAQLRLSGTDVQVEVYQGDHLATARDSFADVLVFLRRVMGP